MRGKKALYNSIAYLVMECVSVLCGFILPRAILSAFGSSCNGLTISITQFLSVVTLLRAGVGGVTRAALYKPLAIQDNVQISSIVQATRVFMRKVAFVFAGGMLLFACLYPLLLTETFEYLFTFSLILIMGLSTFVQYYFAITYEILLGADQRKYATAVIQTFTLLANVLTALLLIRLGCGIHAIKLGSAVVYCLNPVLTVQYVCRRYSLDRKAVPDNTALSQRWDAFIHQVAAFLQDNTDVMILTLFSTVKTVSVYSVYYMVANGVRRLMTAMTAGLEAALGNMYAQGDIEGLQKNVLRIEFILFSVAAVVYSCLFVLIVPFIALYTAGVTDANYIQPAFAAVLAASQYVNCIRTPYLNLVDAAGHFRQTRTSALIECILNITISIGTVIPLGLTGVVLGTLVSNVFRTLYLSFYAYRQILQCRNYSFFKRVACSTTIIAVVYIVMTKFVQLPITGVWDWLLCAVMTTGLAMVLVLVSALLWDRDVLKDCFGKIMHMFRRQI